jgi:integrase
MFMSEKWKEVKLEVFPFRVAGAKKYKVDGYVPSRKEFGKRVRLRKQPFPSAKAAEVYVRDQEREIENHFEDGVRRRTKLTVDQEEDARAALKLLEGFHDHSLQTAAAFCLSHFKEKSTTDVKIGEAKEQYVAFLKDTKSDVHFKNMNRRLTKFADVDPAKLVSDFTTQDLKSWINRPDWDVGAIEKKNERACLHAFFNYCVEEEWTELNPATKVRKIQPKRGRPQIFTPEQAESLLRAAERVNGGCMVPFFALGLYAALRPSEVTGSKDKPSLEWSDFDWEDKTVTVNGKGEGRWRCVDLPEACVKWLERWKDAEGSVVPKNHRKLFDLVRAVAGFYIKRERLSVTGGGRSSIDCTGFESEVAKCEAADRPQYIQDGLRHTAISYRLKIVKHKGEVALWAGNSPQMIDTHYLGQVKKQKHVDAYYAIAPSAGT